MSEIAVPPSEDAAHGVRDVTSADVPAVSRALARAFFEDPVVGEWCLPDQPRRMSRLEGVFELFLERVYLRHGECYAADGLVGAALWAPPGAWSVGALAQLGLVARLVPTAGRSTVRIVRALSFLEARHPHEPHYYLAFAGVEPGRQGRGIGSALMAPVLQRCDREHLPAYLEATCERNVALYGRHGFAVVEELALPGGGPPVWRMWREAHAS